MTSLRRFQFSVVFHAVIGMTLRSYRQKVKFKWARRFMLRPSMSLTETASRAGFYDLAHLGGRVSRRLRGMTPKALRAHLTRARQAKKRGE